MILCVEQAAIKANSAEDLLGGLLEMIRREDVRRLGEQAPRGVQVELGCSQKP